MEFQIHHDHIVEKAFSHLKESLAEEFSKLSKQELKQVKEAMSETTRIYLELVRKVQDGKAPEECLSHLDEDHITVLKSSLENQTFEMSLKESKDVTFMSHGRQLEYPAMLSYRTSEGADHAGMLQIASIIIESVIFVLNVIGISVPGNAGSRQVVERVLEIIRRIPVVNGIIARMVAAASRGNIREIVEYIMKLVIALWKGGAFIAIAREILGDMSAFDWVITVAKITAELVAIVATGGVALVAQLIVQVANAVSFIQKLSNLTMLAGTSAQLKTFVY